MTRPRLLLLDFGRVLCSGPTPQVMASTEMRHAHLGDVEMAG